MKMDIRVERDVYKRQQELENIPIKACLQMASGINFDEDTDVSGFSMKTLMGVPAMKVIAKYGTNEKPYACRRYLSINTEILGQIIKNTTGRGLAEYMEEKLWKKIGKMCIRDRCLKQHLL